MNDWMDKMKKNTSGNVWGLLKPNLSTGTQSLSAAYEAVKQYRLKAWE